MVEKALIGWQEWCSLPGLGIGSLKAKIDTGAKTSALHATDIKVITIDGQEFVKFCVHEAHCIAPLVDTRVVINSGGNREKRHVIKTGIAMGPFKWNIEITLTNRGPMTFRMLLGRQALRGRFFIDPKKRFALGKL